MGAWGEKPWENDGAADWFSILMERIDTTFILDQAELMSETPDGYEDEIRAVSYILSYLGRNYIWPIEEIVRLKSIKIELTGILEGMLAPESDFLELWDNDEVVKQEIRKEIQQLNG